MLLISDTNINNVGNTIQFLIIPLRQQQLHNKQVLLVYTPHTHL